MELETMTKKELEAIALQKEDISVKQAEAYAKMASVTGTGAYEEGVREGAMIVINDTNEKMVALDRLEEMLNLGVTNDMIDEYQALREKAGLSQLEDIDIATIVNETMSRPTTGDESSEGASSEDADYGEREMEEPSLSPETPTAEVAAEDHEEEVEEEKSMEELEIASLTARMEALRELKEETGLDKADTDHTVIDEIDKEYEALSQMKNLLEAGLDEETIKIYLSEREKTGLESLSEEDINRLLDESILKSSSVVTQRELKAIEERMKILKTIKDNKTIATVKNSEKFLEEISKEYDALSRMKYILKEAFTLSSVSEYLDQRSKTKLPPLQENDIQKMLEEKAMSQGTPVTDAELAAIDNRLKDLDALKQDEAVYSEFSDEVKQEIDKEYEALNNMKTMLTKGLTIADVHKYLEERRKTQLEPLAAGDLEKLIEEGKIKKIKNDAKPVTPKKGEETPQADNNNNSDDPQGNPDNNTDEKKEEKSELVEVEKVTVWQWIKQHKKEILIALGITALTISVVFALTQVIPALIAASKAAEVAGLSAQMVANSQMWAAASASEQVALHGANTALAGVISSLTGAANTFNAGTGVWTIGSQALPAFASGAAAASTAAAANASSLTGISLLSGIGGAGLLGMGIFPFVKKSESYKLIKKQIKELHVQYDHLTAEQRVEVINSITDEINTSEELSDNEKKSLLRKLQKAVKQLKQHEKDSKEDTPETKEPVKEEPETKEPEAKESGESSGEESSGTPGGEEKPEETKEEDKDLVVPDTSKEALEGENLDDALEELERMRSGKTM